MFWTFEYSFGEDILAFLVWQLFGLLYPKFGRLFPKLWVTQIDTKVSTKDNVGQIVFDQMTLNILIRLCPGPNVIKLFWSVIYEF